MGWMRCVGRWRRDGWMTLVAVGLPPRGRQRCVDPAAYGKQDERVSVRGGSLDRDEAACVCVCLGGVAVPLAVTEGGGRRQLHDEGLTNCS